MCLYSFDYWKLEVDFLEGEGFDVRRKIIIFERGMWNWKKCIDNMYVSIWIILNCYSK